MIARISLVAYISCLVSAITPLKTNDTTTDLSVSSIATAAAVDDCAICLERMSLRDDFVRRCQQCKRATFHNSCISTWSKKSIACPLCRGCFVPSLPELPPSVALSRTFKSRNARDALRDAQTAFETITSSPTEARLEFVAPPVPELQPYEHFPSGKGYEVIPRLPLTYSAWGMHCVVGNYVTVRTMRPQLSPNSNDIIWKQLSNSDSFNGLVVRAGSDACTVEDIEAQKRIVLQYPYKITPSSYFHIISPTTEEVATIWRQRAFKEMRWPLLEFLNANMKPTFPIDSYDWFINCRTGDYVRVVSLDIVHGRLDVARDVVGKVLSSSFQKEECVVAVFSNGLRITRTIKKSSMLSSQRLNIDKEPYIFFVTFKDPTIPVTAEVNYLVERCAYTQLSLYQKAFLDSLRLQPAKKFHFLMPAIYGYADDEIWLPSTDGMITRTPQSLADQRNACVVDARVLVMSFARSRRVWGALSVSVGVVLAAADEYCDVRADSGRVERVKLGVSSDRFNLIKTLRRAPFNYSNLPIATPSFMSRDEVINALGLIDVLVRKTGLEDWVISFILSERTGIKTVQRALASITDLDVLKFHSSDSEQARILAPFLIECKPWIDRLKPRA